MTDQIKMRGEYRIIARDTSGRLLWAKRINNMLTAINKTSRAAMLMGTYTGDGTEFEIKYFAFGTGTTTPTPADTSLEVEVYRKQVTQMSVDGGVVTSVVSLGAAEGNYEIGEIGVFCGPTASATADTGMMLSRVLVNIDKNTNIVINITRRDICTI